MILDIAGAVGLAAVEVPVKQPLSSENSVRLKYSHLPDLPPGRVHRGVCRGRRKL